MTRINVTAVSDLADQHLLAEYRELPMVAGSLRRSLKSKNGIKNRQQTYTLGAGHVTYFYDKGLFLYKRYQEILKEFKVRGFTADPNREIDFDTFKNNGLFNDWTPTEKDLKVLIPRLNEKLDMKPSWYKYYGKSLTELDTEVMNKLRNPRLYSIPS